MKYEAFYNCLNIGIILLIFYLMQQSQYNLRTSLLLFQLYSIFVIVKEILVHVSSEVTSPKGFQELYENKWKSKNETKKILHTILLSFCSIICSFILTILFGAYIFQYIEETFTFSVLLASVIFIRPLIHLGPSAVLMIIEEWNWQNQLQVKSALAVAGGWLGAIPIPLDWDRPWQIWPITCCTGILIAEVLSSSHALFSAKRNKIV